jgi:hypothetical protein
MFPRVIPVDGLIVEISPGIPSTGASLTIPIVFIYIETDLHFASAAAIKKVRNKLTERGIQNQTFEVKPFDLSAGISFEKLPGFIDKAISKALFDDLVKEKFLDSRGRLIKNP